MGYSNLQFSRLAMGRLLGDLSARLQERVMNPTTDKLRLALYACHDTSVGGILNALQCFDNKWPAFTAYLSFELFQKAKDRTPSSWLAGLGFGRARPDFYDYYVRIRYDSKDLRLPFCSQPGKHLEGSNGTVCTCELKDRSVDFARLTAPCPIEVQAFKDAVKDISMTSEQWERECKGV